MTICFLLLDAHRFHREIVPPLGAGWRQRSFRPCRELCAALTPEAAAFRQRYFAGSEEPLLCQVARGLPFTRDFWRLLVAEVLLFAAAELPEVQTAPDTLRRLITPGCPDGHSTREHFSPVEQVHFGARDLEFGPAFYRPETAGYNDAADVDRLTAFLDAVDPARWSAGDLRSLPGLEALEDRDEELEFARDWFPPLRQVYRDARRRGQIVICDNSDNP